MCNYVESLLWSEMFNDRFHLMYSPRLGTFAPMCQFGRSVIRRVLSKLLFDQTPTAQSGNHEVRRDNV